MGGGLGKIFKGVTKPFSKALGSITGANQQSKMIDQQSQAMAESNRQQQQMAAQAMQQSTEQAAQQRRSEESRDARERAVQQAADAAAKAREGDSGAVDVDISPDTPMDEDGRRINTREQFQSSRRKATSGLQL